MPSWVLPPCARVDLREIHLAAGQGATLLVVKKEAGALGALRCGQEDQRFSLRQRFSSAAGRWALHLCWSKCVPPIIDSPDQWHPRTPWQQLTQGRSLNAH